MSAAATDAEVEEIRRRHGDATTATDDTTGKPCQKPQEKKGRNGELGLYGVFLTWQPLGKNLLKVKLLVGYM